MAEKEKTKQELLVEAEIAAAQSDPTPSTPVNLRPPPPTTKRVPSPGVKQFVVRTRGVPSFRRCGLMFSPDPVTVEVSALTPAQQVELLNTETLTIEEVGGAKLDDKKGAKG